MKKIYIVGSLNMDLCINTPYIPRGGETMHGYDFISNPGGKGANQAVSVAKLGGEAYMVGAVGKEFGDELVSTLKGYGVNTDYVFKFDRVSSGVAIILIENGENRIILDAGANAKVSKEMVDNALSSAADGDYLICQLEIPLSTVEYALECAKRKKMITILNPAPAKKLDNSIFKYCDYFIVNQTESEFYTGIYPSDRESSTKCADALKKLGVKNMVITMGKVGSVAIVNDEYYKVESVKVDAIDTTAAGDTYVGAFVVKNSQGETVENAMKFASLASSITVIRKGAQQSIPYEKECLK